MGTIAEDFTPAAGKSNYFRMTPGDHRIRVLGNSVSGWEYWEDTPDGGRKPVRLTIDQNPPIEFADTVKKFLAFPIWNYEIERIQIWEVTQSSIQKELKAYDKDKEWGDLTGYDLGIERTGSDMQTTRYRIVPKPKSELSKEIETIVKLGLPNLAALFDGDDPFSSDKVDDKKLPF